MNTGKFTLRTKEEKETIRRLWADNLASPNPKSASSIAKELGIIHSTFFYIIDPQYREKTPHTHPLHQRS